MNRSKAQKGLGEQNLIMLTTTRIPYVYHIPPILSCPPGIPYWFRYQHAWLEQRVAEAEHNELRDTSGILYLRDNDSRLKLCYPLRRFRVLWHENKHSLSFFYLELGELIRYRAFVYDHHKNTLEEESLGNEASLANVTQEIQARAESGTPLEKMCRFTAPTLGEPPILKDKQIRANVDLPASDVEPMHREEGLSENTYVWLDKRSMFKHNLISPQCVGDENDKWVNQVQALCTVRQLHDVCFWRILSLEQLHKPKRKFTPKKLYADESGFHTHGYALPSNRCYGLEICQLIPGVFSGKAPDIDQFTLNIKSSDPGIEPITGSETIDGGYGRYELSFELIPRLSGKTTLVKVSCTQEVESKPVSSAQLTPTNDSDKQLETAPAEGKLSAPNQIVENTRKTGLIPASVIPIKIKTRWKKRFIFCLLTLASVSVFVLHRVVYNWIFGGEIQDFLSYLVQVVSLSLSLVFSGPAGTTDIVKSLSKLKG